MNVVLFNFKWYSQLPVLCEVFKVSLHNFIWGCSPHFPFVSKLPFFHSLYWFQHQAFCTILFILCSKQHSVRQLVTTQQAFAWYLFGIYILHTIKTLLQLFWIIKIIVLNLWIYHSGIVYINQEDAQISIIKRYFHIRCCTCFGLY